MTAPAPAVAPSDASAARRVLVFDSGLGGLTVARQIRALRPDLDLAYVADTAIFPYGALDDATLIARVLQVLDALAPALAPDAIVIACNTASTLVLPALRARFGCPIVGTVPAIKPAAAASRSGMIAVLATPGTVRRDYTQELVRTHAQGCAVALVGAARLATLAERCLRGAPCPDDLIRDEIAPCFRLAEDGSGRRTDVIALACTHFPLLLPRLVTLAPWPVQWIDPAPAIARRVASLLPHEETRARPPATGRVIMTGDPDGAERERSAIEVLLAASGLGRPEHHPLPTIGGAGRPCAA
jgi:glutamate racemase